MSDVDDATLINATLDHDRKATPGEWVAVLGGITTTLAATVEETHGHWDNQIMRTGRDDLAAGNIGGVCMTRGKYEREMANAEAIAAYRTAAPELARRLAERNQLVAATAHPCGACERHAEEMQRLEAEIDRLNARIGDLT